MRPERGQMRCDTCLVVGTTPPVQASIALGRLEGWRYPLLAVAFGLHVVVRIQQHGGCTGGRRVLRDDRRGAALTDDPHVAKTRLRQQIRHSLRAAMYLVATAGGGPHRFD